MKRHTLILISLLATISISAQEVISTQGDSYSGSGLVLDFTVGEVIINTASTSVGSNTLTQGFHQSKWSVVGIRDLFPDFEANVFPNPLEEVLNIEASAYENVKFFLYDAQGKLVREDKLYAELSTIELSELAAGAYSLLLTKANQNLKTFKLIKTN
ncbi:MAG: T9SS type A sorting domain-containing protein [Chitinophagales bacterium]